MNCKYKNDSVLTGKRIATSRKMLGLTQEELALQIGIAGKHLSEIERGISGVSVGTLIEISRALNVSTDYLLLGTETANTPLNYLLEQLTPAQKQYAERIIELLVACCNDNKINVEQIFKE